jgi:hypothetical protein
VRQLACALTAKWRLAQQARLKRGDLEYIRSVRAISAAVGGSALRANPMSRTFRTVRRSL